MLAGAAGGALAATGATLGVMIAGNAVISMAENAANQVSANGGVKNLNLDIGDIIFDGVVGGIMGAIGGPGKGSKHYTNLGKQVVRRTFDALSHDGIQAGIREAGKAFAYYGKNMTKYYANLAKGLVSELFWDAVSSSITSSAAKSKYCSVFS